MSMCRKRGGVAVFGDGALHTPIGAGAFTGTQTGITTDLFAAIETPPVTDFPFGLLE